MRKIIDIHCHIYPDKIAEKAANNVSVFYDNLEMLSNGKVSSTIEASKSAGISHLIVHSVATTPEQVSSINKFISNCVSESNGYMTGLGTLYPNDETIYKDFEELLSLGLKGVKLHPDIQGFKIDDYRMLKIYEICEKNNVPILMHTGDSRFDLSNPNRLKPILDIYKNLTIIGAHFGGWSIWNDACKVLHNYDNFYVDCSSSLYALTANEAKNIIKSYGTNKVMFGADTPMWNQKQELERFMNIDLTEQERDDIYLIMQIDCSI